MPNSSDIRIAVLIKGETKHAEGFLKSALNYVKFPQQTGLFGQSKSSSDEPLLSFGQSTLSSGQPPLCSGQSTLSFGEPPLRFGQSTLRFGEPPLRFGQSTLSSGQSTWRFGQSTLSSGQPTVRVTLGLLMKAQHISSIRIFDYLYFFFFKSSIFTEKLNE